MGILQMFLGMAKILLQARRAVGKQRADWHQAGQDWFQQVAMASTQMSSVKQS